MTEISFIKQYPYYYEVDEDKEIMVDFSRPAHPIHYSGLYDSVSGIFSGG